MAPEILITVSVRESLNWDYYIKPFMAYVTLLMRYLHSGLIYTAGL